MAERSKKIKSKQEDKTKLKRSKTIKALEDDEEYIPNDIGKKSKKGSK